SRPKLKVADQDKLYAQYMDLIVNPDRIDTEFLMTHGFSDLVKLYSSYVVDGKLIYPHIIAGLANIGPQPFLIIGNQPSYEKVGDRVRKVGSSPSPKDYKFVRRELQRHERFDLPVVYSTSTLGAEPSLDAERQGQSTEIAETILA